MNTAIIPLISTIVSLIFALTVLDQWFARRKAYQLVWAIGLLMYGIATLAEFWTESSGLTLTSYRLWYLFGAICAAAYLGMGTLYLLMPRKVAHIIMSILLVISIYGAISVFTANIDISTLQYSAKIMPTQVRLTTAFLNIFGTFGLIGGAIYSAWIFWRRRILPNRVVSNVLIAVGAILPAAGGTSMGLTGSVKVGHYLFELIGIIIIFIGFLRSSEVFGLYRFPLIHGFKKESAE